MYGGHEAQRLATDLVEKRRRSQFLIVFQDCLVTKVIRARQAAQLRTQPVLDRRVFRQEEQRPRDGQRGRVGAGEHEGVDVM